MAIILTLGRERDFDSTGDHSIEFSARSSSGKVRGRFASGCAVAAAFSLLTVACPGNGSLRQLRAGDVVPDYAAVTLTGDTVSLESLRGRVVLLNMWATWCEPCRSETPFLQSKFEEYRDRGLEIVGVSMDRAGASAAIDAFVRQYGVTYRILHDSPQLGMGLFRVIGLPATFLINRDGSLRWFRYGPITETNREFVAAIEDALR